MWRKIYNFLSKKKLEVKIIYLPNRKIEIFKKAINKMYTVKIK